MNTDRTRGAQLGDPAPQNDPTVPPPPPPPGSHHSATQTANASGNATVTQNNTQKNTQLKFSIPVVGPLLSLAYAHPLIAGLTAVAVIGGGGAAVTAALPDSTSSPSTTLVRGFVMKTDSAKAPPGYDFTPTPPVVADAGTDAIYLQGTFLYSTNGKMAAWSSSAVPTAEGCREAVTEHPVRQTTVSVSYVVCYLDRNGDPGYISVTASDNDSITVDTAHLS
ncbi:hypothetical protein OG352_00970 [Streptomyces sp. NBC_01485]|uniref:hypothetical protein n=1 Tax=Streptomyces sp. NBC_01485 TaxID=2903884 RepID=UPI002E2F7A5A|nr:hypothetical protein [Streptomyces sp. NBC_01485]